MVLRARKWYDNDDDDDEERLMHSKSNIIEIMINDEAHEVIKKLFDSLKNRYRSNLELTKGS